MFNCIWNGEIISADKIAESEVSERKVRNAAIRDELICICPDCEFRRLTYKHGDKKRPHFAHIKNSNCTYSQFDKMDKPVIRHIRNALYKHFKNLGYDIEQEVYLPNSRKFVHLLLNFPNKKIVLQIAEESISTRTREELSTVCEESGCDLKWIVIGDTDAIQDDYDNHHINRYLLHNSRNNDLIIISKNATTISQTSVLSRSKLA